MSEQTEQKVVHVLGISGGKDSTALAVYMRDRVPDMHYYFCDTGEELEETYEYLAKLENFLGKPITRLNPDRPFSHYLKIYNNYLPSPRMRWCTAKLKIEPFERWLDSEFPGAQIMSYVAIRADENRDGYISHKENIQAVYPFKEDGKGKEDVFRILEDVGLGLPEYYKWRTRSGCYFCFFQRKVEWANLKREHPDLYEKAKTFEKEEVDPLTGVVRRYTWSQNESLIQLEQPERVAKIRAMHEEAIADEQRNKKPGRLAEIFEKVLDDEDSDQACLICHL